MRLEQHVENNNNISKVYTLMIVPCLIFLLMIIVNAPDSFSTVLPMFSVLFNRKVLDCLRLYDMYI